MAKSTLALKFRSHARRRALERYNLNLSDHDIKIMSRMITGNHSDKVEFIERSSNDRTIWRITFAGKTMKAVYSKRHKSIVTILHENSDESQQEL